MKIISAGFPKTGTKSASQALRQIIWKSFRTNPLWLKNHFKNEAFRILGYNVCDVLESAHCGIVKIWLDFMNGERPIEDVLEAYQKHGFGQFPRNIQEYVIKVKLFQMQIKTYQEIFTGNPYLMHVQIGDPKNTIGLRVYKARQQHAPKNRSCSHTKMQK